MTDLAQTRGNGMRNAAEPGFDAEAVRRDFPIFDRPVYGKRLVFLDSAASAQKPRAVIEAERACYETYYANVHRGVYRLSQEATAAFENARKRTARFLNAGENEIVFTRGTTEAINLVAECYGRAHLRAGDEIVLTELEHHANIVPWQFLRDKIGVTLKIVPFDEAGEVHLDAFVAALGPRTKFAAIAHVSNALGTILPVKAMIEAAHAQGVTVLVDGAQAVPHMTVDVCDLGADFYAFSAHKLYGPTGIGVLFGRADLLDAMPPYQGGGDMIQSVTFAETTYQKPPFRFEAGTPHIAGAVGLHAAIDYVEALGLDVLAAHEEGLRAYATRVLGRTPGVRLIGTAPRKAGVISFVVDGVHPHDAGTILDRDGVAVRAGHHCAQPVMEHFGVAATVRASFGCYNTRDDVDALAASIVKARDLFGL